MQFVIGYSNFGVSLKSLNTELVRYMNSKKFPEKYEGTYHKHK